VHVDDILLIFVPQWSPFQPPLSLPSLSAWLRRSGYTVSCVDANIEFYEWLISKDCIPYLESSVQGSTFDEKIRRAYRTIFEAREDFEHDIAKLRVAPVGAGKLCNRAFLQRSYTGFKAFDSYLAAVSDVADGITISPFDFSVEDGLMETRALEKFADAPPLLADVFARNLINRITANRGARSIGLSCIGQEQLAFTLLFGRLFKELTGSPVLVGGTILSRVFEKGILKEDWFHKYFDIVVRNEGERPSEQILSNIKAGSEITRDVPGIVFLANGAMEAKGPPSPLKPSEVPVPDFDSMPLGRYFCPEITLPILASRGCYWGKCEFCHHGMVFGDKYSSHDSRFVLDMVETLSDRYGVKHFAFNDEAVPPKILASIGEIFPDHMDSGYSFTGLIKFERYFTKEHFDNLARIGFRSLYVGLESASERVLRLMKKHNDLVTIERNLTDARMAGIWFHCFLFFGFPGETEGDAQLTYDFILRNHEIIGSFGCGTFSLEHNAPIHKHPNDFNLEIINNRNRDLDVYYDYKVASGLNASDAIEWSERLYRDSKSIDKYSATNWIPREMLLSLLSRMGTRELVAECISILNNKGVPRTMQVSDVISSESRRTAHEDIIIVNRLNRKVTRIEGSLMSYVKEILHNNEYFETTSHLDPFLDDFVSLK